MLSSFVAKISLPHLKNSDIKYFLFRRILVYIEHFKCLHQPLCRFTPNVLINWKYFAAFRCHYLFLINCQLISVSDRSFRILKCQIVVCNHTSVLNKYLNESPINSWRIAVLVTHTKRFSQWMGDFQHQPETSSDIAKKSSEIVMMLFLTCTKRLFPASSPILSREKY